MARRYFLALFSLTSYLVSGQPLTYELKGQSFYVRPDITQQPDKILWKHNDNKVVEFNGQEEQVYGRFHNRVTLDWVTAELIITDLNYEDSGMYELKTNKQQLQLLYKLEVVGKVSKPTISCDVNNGSLNLMETRATLTCSADPTHPQSLMRYEWESNGNNLLSGPTLSVLLGDEHDDQTYTCRVSNPKTAETAVFTVKNCNSAQSSSAPLIGSLITIFLLVVFVILGIWFCRRSRQACFAKRSRDNVETQLPLGTKEEMEKGEESRPLFDRAPTLPSHQRLDHLDQHNRNMTPNLPATNHYEDEGEGFRKNADTFEKSDTPQFPLGRKPSFSQDQDNVPCNVKGEEDDTQLGGSSEEDTISECSDSESTNEQCNLESCTAPEHTEPEKEANSPHADGICLSTIQPKPPSPTNSADSGTEGASIEYEDGDSSDQVNGETSQSSESDDVSRDKQVSITPEQCCSENDSDEKESQDSSQQETDPTLSDNSPQPPQSPTQKETCNTQTNTSEAPLTTSLDDQDQGLEPIMNHETDDSEGQSDSKTDRETELAGGNRNLAEDKDQGTKETEVGE